MTIDELQTLRNDLKRFADEYCHTSGLQNNVVEVNHVAGVVGLVIDRKLRILPQPQLWEGDS